MKTTRTIAIALCLLLVVTAAAQAGLRGFFRKLGRQRRQPAANNLNPSGSSSGSQGGSYYNPKKLDHASGTEGLMKATFEIFTRLNRRKLHRMSHLEQREFGEATAVTMVHQLGSKILPMKATKGHRTMWQYANALPYILAKVSNRPDIPFWRVGILVNDKPTAFSTPGGYIFVTTGLLQLCQNEAELAGVIAHEMVHITRRHGLYIMKKKVDRMMGSMLFAGILMAKSKKQVDPKMVVNILNKVVSASTEMKYGRDKEYWADKYACEWLYRMGYNPLALANFLDRLPSVRELPGLHNHPSGQARARKIRQFVQVECNGAETMHLHRARYNRFLRGCGLR